MRSSRGKNSNSPILAGVLVMVLMVVGGAIWLLFEGETTPVEGDGPLDGPVVVRETAPMQVPEVPDIESEPELMDVPVSLRPVPNQAQFVAEVGTMLRRVSGRVISNNGQPVANCQLKLYKGNPLLVNVNFAGSRKVVDSSTISGQDGSFELLSVPVGRDFILVGEHDDFATTELGNLHVTVARDLTGIVLRMEPGATIEGVVASATGSPIAEARIELFDAIASVQLPPAERLPWKIVFSDNNGQYSFEHVSANSLKVRVQAPGFESQSRMLSFALDARASDRTVDFSLKDGMSLPGRVVDESGNPIPDVRVEATSLTKDYQGTALSNSDRAGFFLLEGMGDNQYYQVRATAKGYSNKVNPKVHVDDGELLIEMEQRLYVEGAVVDHSGSPIRSYSLTLMRAAEGRDPMFLNDTRNFSAADGQFVFDNLDPGSYALEARAKGMAPSWSEPFAVIRTDDPAPIVNITMGLGGTVTGQVLNTLGAAVPNALVKLNANNHLDSPIQGIFAALGGSGASKRKIQTRTDGKGQFSFSNVRAGTYQLASTHASYAPATVNNVVVLDDAVGSNLSVTIHLPRSAGIAGFAMDSNARAIPFCEIQVTNKKSAFLDAATTDSEGRFLFENLAEGTYTLMIKPDRIGSKPINPLMKLMYAQRSQREVFVSAGQAVSDVELYLPDITPGG